MSAQARQAEADRVEQVYYWAVAQLGFWVIQDSLALWHDAPPATPQAASTWLKRASLLVRQRRSAASALGMAYYRLIKALRTGKTVATGSDKPGDVVSIEDLRLEFEKAVNEAAPGTKPAAPQVTADAIEENDGDLPPDLVSDEKPPTLVALDDDDTALAEEIADLDNIIAGMEKEAEQETQELLDTLGSQLLQARLAELDEEDKAKVVDLQREKVNRAVASRQAAAAEMISMNAARGLPYALGTVDKDVIGWVRYSTTGTPCGWCAMLISRGLIFYSSKENAEGQSSADADKYHPNCHCVAVPVFSRDQYFNSDLFKQNREYNKLWPRVTQGYGGKEALRIWRKHFRDLQKAAPEAA